MTRFEIKLMLKRLNELDRELLLKSLNLEERLNEKRKRMIGGLSMNKNRLVLPSKEKNKLGRR